MLKKALWKHVKQSYLPTTAKLFDRYFLLLYHEYNILTSTVMKNLNLGRRNLVA